MNQLRWQKIADWPLTLTAIVFVVAYCGLYKLGVCYYDPSIGRFTQYDPSGQEGHPYAYAGCNPINVSDPTGLSSYCSPSTGCDTVNGVDTPNPAGPTATPGQQNAVAQCFVAIGAAVLAAGWFAPATALWCTATLGMP